MKKVKKADPAELVRVARRIAGDAEQDATPVTDEERSIMNEVCREHRRPSKDEIHNEAKRILK